ncbi:NADP-reducing hydrogenase subunit HndA [bacterium BMS3Abin07]|nr:NADP-reducing hydrogenase subunit HndA [bacterium BMS3Abin07]GBE31259.1 NADP-reducing hydrogenase subunit HndA [bacterium BMS3Bbin05]
MQNTLDMLEVIIENYRRDEGNIISLLQDVQEHFGYVPREAMVYLSESLGIPQSKFFGVATFYSQFHLKPRGENIITACCGTACHVKGSERLINSLLRGLHIPSGEDTSEDKKFTVEKVNCVGACSIAPVVIINKEIHGKMTADRLMKEIKKLKRS